MTETVSTCRAPVAIVAVAAALLFSAAAKADDFVLAQSAAHKLKVFADGGAKWCGAHLKLRMVLDADSPDAGSQAAQLEIISRLKAPIATDCAAANDADLAVFVQDKPQGSYRATKAEGWAFKSTATAARQPASLDAPGEQAATAAAQPTAASANDVPGSKDPPFLKRFEGSEIVVYQTKSYEEYAMVTATSRGWETPAKVEGAVTRIMYRVPEGHTGLELLRNYEHALAEAGFALTYEFTQTDNYWVKGFIGGFFNQLGRSDGGPHWLYSAAARYVTAKATKDGQDLTVAVLVGESNGGKWSNNPKDPVIKPGEILVGVDVVTAKAVDINMVAVKSDTLAKALAETGKVDIYGILFDVDKTDIKPASAPTLEQVAKLLKDDPALKLEIAGHTDSTGDKDHNAKLSDSRAAAVVQALVTTYGIDAARLQAKGYGDTQPVAPNDNEEGRAKNRRVELRKI